MTTYKVGDTVKYVFRNLQNQSRLLDGTIWLVTRVTPTQLYVKCLDKANSDIRIGDNHNFDLDRFKLIDKRPTKELICEKIKQMKERHKTFLEKRNNGTLNTQGTVSTVF